MRGRMKRKGEWSGWEYAGGKGEDGVRGRMGGWEDEWVGGWSERDEGVRGRID